jgi:hypothetical protein
VAAIAPSTSGLAASTLLPSEMFHKRVAAGLDREDAIREVIRYALIESWDHDRDEAGERIPSTGQAAIFDHAAKSRFTLIRTLVWYFEEFAHEKVSTLITSSGEPAVEATFRIEVDNGILFSGHLDRVVVEDGDNFVHDQKTSGQTLSPYYFKQFKPDSQFSMYTFAGKAVYGIPISGVLIDAAQIAVGFTRFARLPTTRTDDELEEWYDETMNLIERTQQMTRENFFPRNPASCNNFGGCDFREICSRPPHVRKNFLQADFVKGDQWNPLDQR